MPHRHSPKVCFETWSVDMERISTRVDAMTVAIDGLVCRLQRLEQIDVLVDFFKIENMCDKIVANTPLASAWEGLQKNASEKSLQELPGDCIQTRCESSQPAYQTQSSCEFGVAFDYLNGMAEHITLSMGPIVVQGDAPDFEFEGTSKLQNNFEKRARSEDMVNIARDMWRAWGNTGKTGGLIILGCKGYLKAGALVETVPAERLYLQTDDGQRHLTTSTVFEVLEVWKNGYKFILLTDTEHDSNCIYICGRVAKQQPVVQFRIIGHTD